MSRDAQEQNEQFSLEPGTFFELRCVKQNLLDGWNGGEKIRACYTGAQLFDCFQKKFYPTASKWLKQRLLDVGATNTHTDTGNVSGFDLVLVDMVDGERETLREIVYRMPKPVISKKKDLLEQTVAMKDLARVEEEKIFRLQDEIGYLKKDCSDLQNNFESERTKFNDNQSDWNRRFADSVSKRETRLQQLKDKLCANQTFYDYKYFETVSNECVKEMDLINKEENVAFEQFTAVTNRHHQTWLEFCKRISAKQDQIMRKYMEVERAQKKKDVYNFASSALAKLALEESFEKEKQLKTLIKSE